MDHPNPRIPPNFPNHNQHTQQPIQGAVSDITVPPSKPEMIAAADARIDEMEEQYQMGLVTEDEKYQNEVMRLAPAPKADPRRLARNDAQS